jgi:TRAP-type mannitol/chloroaromatic compound transport system permease small subunit
MSQTTNFILPHWIYWGWLAFMPLVFMWLTRGATASTTEDEDAAAKILAEEDPVMRAPGNAFTRACDWMVDKSGVFVSLWTVNAVCIYFYEVVARYIFDSPTIWAHQASYLMFGMQYLLAGGFALLHGDHVRVDVVYIKLPERARIGMDIFTSTFFFIFAVALAGTCLRFFTDSLNMSEVTEETWQVQFYPVKGAMVLGGILLMLAGLSKLIKDIQLFALTAGGKTA